VRPTENAEPAGKSKRGCLLLGSLAALLGILVVLMFLPGVIAARRSAARRACSITNLVQIEVAIQTWRLEAKKAGTDTYSLNEPKVLAYMKGSVLPICPAGGRYSPGTNFADVPRCNIAGHTL